MRTTVHRTAGLALTVLAALTVCTVTALPAGALPAAAAPEPTRAEGEWSFVDDYWNRSECENAGQRGQEVGSWKRYLCSEGWLDWDLYVIY
ncbi:MULTISPECIES: hypothetical protein [Actinosynnema]|uniref:hypothetical protein n=1 Tax=Actinosynnema TaxID=40566 RepID=UPI0020A397A4|nr:hypothetical protein [Actinosynnema pretiosum]MCP2092520.1 hypothetical protein [Actinosynnema pretiosum]